MAVTNVGPVKQAFVRALRDITALKAAVGSDGIHEGIAPPKTEYPFVVYSMAASRRRYSFDENPLLISTFDVFVISADQVEAHNLDQLVLTGMQDKILTFDAGSEQSTLLCRRFMDLSFVNVDDAGKKVYQVGGSYSVWTGQ